MNNNDLNQHLLLAFSKGDRKAFERIYNLYSKKLFKRLIFLTKDADDAEELLQNTFLKLWTKRETIDVTKNIYNYIESIGNSLAIDALRRNIRKQSVYDTISLHKSSKYSRSVEEKYLEKEVWEIIGQAVEGLPAQRKLIFTMCKLEGKSYDEVSEELGISTSTISNQLVLAMKFVRDKKSIYQKEVKIMFLVALLKIFVHIQ